MRKATCVSVTLTILLLFYVGVALAADAPRIDPVNPDVPSLEDTTPTPCGPCAQVADGDWVKVKCYCWKKSCLGKKRLVVYYKWVRKTTSDVDYGGVIDDEPGTSVLPPTQPGDQSTGETPTAARGPKEKD